MTKAPVGRMKKAEADQARQRSINGRKNEIKDDFWSDVSRDWGARPTRLQEARAEIDRARRLKLGLKVRG